MVNPDGRSSPRPLRERLNERQLHHHHTHKGNIPFPPMNSYLIPTTTTTINTANTNTANTNTANTTKKKRRSGGDEIRPAVPSIIVPLPTLLNGTTTTHNHHHHHASTSTKTNINTNTAAYQQLIQTK